jgi:hypothetical protein
MSGNSDRRITRWPPYASYVMSVASTNLPYTTLQDATQRLRDDIDDAVKVAAGMTILAERSVPPEGDVPGVDGSVSAGIGFS